MSSLLVAIVLLGIGTIAYFRRTVNGNLTGNTGNLVLIVNEANAVAEESFDISINRGEEEPYVYPDDKGTFDINIDSTGSDSDVVVTLSITRTKLPDNLKFYLDENYNKELTSKTFKIEKSNDMTMSVPVYWFWDGSVDDTNDSKYINVALSAKINVVANSYSPTYLNEIIDSSSYTLDTNVDFSETSSSTNGVELMMMDGTQNDEYPIMYYRGNVSNNNVIFADLCWMMVRTIETGGMKLIYNGSVNSNGSCPKYTDNFTSSAAFAKDFQYSDFNKSVSSPEVIGYMYNDDIRHSPSYKKLDSEGYILYLSDNSIDSETGRHTQNKYDSKIKKSVDSWYEEKILGTKFEHYIEDTVWCVDRSVISETYSIENYATNYIFNFAAYTRLKENVPSVTPSLSCARDVDKFTVKSENGNGDLTYPIALLTADEAVLAGAVGKENTFLTLDNRYQWLLSPFSFDYSYVKIAFINQKTIQSGLEYNSYIFRPSISIKLTSEVLNGDGTITSPYYIG